MWQRFTEDSRKVIFYAQEEAGKLGENYVSSEHFLLGLIRDYNIATRILDRLGISVEAIRNEALRTVTPGEGRLSQDMQLTPRAKRVIDLAYDEARMLHNSFIGCEHLFLGLIREGVGTAAIVLKSLGVTVESVRQANVDEQKNPTTAASKAKTTLHSIPLDQAENLNEPMRKFDSLARKSIALAWDEANRYGVDVISTHHLLVSIITDEQSSAAKLLATLNIPLDLVRQKVEDYASSLPENPRNPQPVIDFQAQYAIKFANIEAGVLKSSTIGTEHLLLGLIHEPTGQAAIILAELGVDLPTARKTIAGLQN